MGLLINEALATDMLHVAFGSDSPTFVKPASLWLAAFTSTSDAWNIHDAVTSSGAPDSYFDHEVAAAGYARLEVPQSAFLVSEGQVRNISDIVMTAAAEASWGTIRSVAFVTSQSGATHDDIVISLPLNQNVPVATGDPFGFGAGDLIFGLSTGNVWGEQPQVGGSSPSSAGS